MDNAKGAVIGLLYTIVFFAVYFAVSLPSYAVVALVFGEIPFSDRFMSAIPYLGIRGIQVGACAMSGAYVAAWVCGRFLNSRSAVATIITFVVLTTGNLIAAIYLGAGAKFELLDYIMLISALAIGYAYGIELLGKAVARNKQDT